MNTVLLNKPSYSLGYIIKSYREKIGLNQAEIAEKAGISPSMLSQIERSVVSPSIDTLFAVCDALGLDIAHLFGRMSGRDRVRIHHKGERLKTKGNGAKYEQLVISMDAAHSAEMFLLEVGPKRRIGLSNAGHEGAEMGYVFSGKAKLVINKKEYILKEGDSVTFDSSLPHSLKNIGNMPFKAIWNALPPHRDYLEVEEKGALYGKNNNGKNI